MCNKEETLNLINTLSFYFSILTGFFSLITILLYFLLKSQRSILFRVILYMAIADLIRSIYFIVTPIIDNRKALCNILAVVGNSIISMNSIWSFYIVFLLFQIYSQFPKQASSHLKIWSIFAFIVAPTFQLFPLITDSYGLNEGCCTYQKDSISFIWRSIQEFFLLFGMIVALCFYFKIYFKLSKLKIIDFQGIVFEKGMIYSIISFVNITALIFFRFLEIFVDFCDLRAVAIFSYCLFTLHGFFNFIALWFNKEFRAKVLMFISGEENRLDSDYYVVNAISE